MAACTAKVYLFIGLGTIWFGLSSASWSFKEYNELKKAWDKCGFPPKQIYTGNDTDLLKTCKGDHLTTHVEDLCSIFTNFTYYECDNSPEKELEKKSTLVMEFYQISHDFYLCDENIGVRIPEGIQSRFKDQACWQTCSEMEAENICRLLVIFAITDYKGLEAVVNQFIRTAATQANTSPATQANTSPATQANTSPATLANTSPVTPAAEAQTETSAPETVTSNVTEETPATNATQEKQASNADEENSDSASNLVKTLSADEDSTQGTITLTYGHVMAYGLLFLLIAVGLFLGFYFRKTLLSCLRDNDGSASTAEDGKGNYRKIPAFEKIVPSLDDKAKAKSYIY